MLARSVYSDIVYVDALLRMGWLGPNCEQYSVLSFYMHLQLCELRLFFTAQSHTSTVYAVAVCQSICVCLSQPVSVVHEV